MFTEDGNLLSETVFQVLSLGTGLFLMATTSYEDLRTRTISGRVLLVGSFISVPLAVIGQLAFGRSIVLGLLPGIVLLILVFLFRGHLGLGDSLFVLEMGCLLPYRVNTEGVIIGVVLCGFVGFLLICFKGTQKGAKLPLIPFLTFGYLTALIRWRHLLL